MQRTSFIFFAWLLLVSVEGQECPTGWDGWSDSCYKFIRSPPKNRDDASHTCLAYNAELVSVNTIEENYFIASWLREHDPQHRRWYTSGRDRGENFWVWDGDGTQFSNIDALWLPNQDMIFYKYLAYNYSDTLNRWGLLKVNPSDEMSYICEIPKEKLNEIIIMERNIDYGILVTDILKLPKGPTFTQEPQSVVFDTTDRNQKDYIALKCVADGYPTPSYAWYKEDYLNDRVQNKLIDPLSDGRYTQTDGTLYISNPQASRDRGKYHCAATNKFGTVISQTAHLSFFYIGEFSKKRSPDRGKEFWGKAISCDPPQNIPGLSFYWTRNNFPNFVQEDQRVFSSADGNLYISSVEKVDEARYSCNVQSNVSSTGRTGPFFPFIVEPASSGQKLLFPNNFPKAFPDAPLATQTVKIECVAYGYPIPTYNWTRKGGDGSLPHGAIITNFNRVLILPNVKVEDVGEYICTASNGLDAIHKSITLSIQAMPTFTIPLGHKVADSDSIVTWTCEAFGIPEVSYAWLKNGELLNETDTLSYQDRARYNVQNNILTIDSVRESDEGMYQCRASNQLGTVFSTGQLRVLKMKPSFAKYPLDKEMYAAIGMNFTFPCRPEAAPFPTFTWRRNGVGVPMGGRVRQLLNGYLFLSNVERLDEGRYTCMARNQYGSDESEGVLQVLPPPRMIEYPVPRELAIVNMTKELRCEAYASEILDLAYIWYHNQDRIDFKKHLQYQLGRKLGYLWIHNVTQAEAGEYKCVAKTSVGSVSQTTELLVIGPPGAPGAVLAEELNATSGKVHWSDGYSNGRRILAFSVEGRTNHEDLWLPLATNVTYWTTLPETGRKEVSLVGVLSPWSTYEFRVFALNELGEGPPSEPSPQYNTDMDKPHLPPANVGGGSGKTGSLFITWDPLPPQEMNAPQIWYRVFYKPADSNMEFTKKTLKTLGNIGSYAVNVGDENYYKQYKIKVQAINKIGYGPESPEVVIYSAESMPQIPPSSAKAVPFNSTALNVSWIPLDLTREKIRGKLIGHRIKYWKNGENPELDSLILLSRGERPWGLTVGLQPNTEYYVSVMAYNDAGSGPESEPFLARTFKAAPLRPPTSVHVKAIESTSIMVTWRGVLPSSQEEPIIGYRVRYWESDQDYTTAREVEKYLDGKDLEAIVSGLIPGKVYKLRVMAFSLGGDGKMSSPPWEFRVGEGVPSAWTRANQDAAKSNPFSFVFLLIISILSARISIC